VPEELRQARRWVTWRYQTRNGKATKVPYQPNGKPASVTDPSTWVSFDEALQAATEQGIGLGLVLGRLDDGRILTGLDLDSAISDAGSIEPWAADIVEAIDSYTEISPSGSGVHILAYSKRGLPGTRRRRDGIEFYDGSRYFTCSGQLLSAPVIHDRTEALEELHREIFGEEEQTQPRVVEMPPAQAAATDGCGAESTGLTPEDRSMLEAAFALPGEGELLRRMWEGDQTLWGPGRMFPSQSETDLSFTTRLMRLCEGDIQRVDRIFRHSGLMRPKWLKHPTYRRDTLQLAHDSYLERRGSERLPAREIKPKSIDPLKYSFTDVGNGDRIRDMHGDFLRYCHAQKRWYVWDTRRWKQDDTGFVMECAKQCVDTLEKAALALPEESEIREPALRFVAKSRSYERLRAALACAQSSSGIPILPEEFDRNLYELNVLNGIIDLKTGALKPHDPLAYHTRCAPVVYDPDARSEDWERFLIESADGDEELVSFLRRACGYSITGDVSEEVLFLIHGPKRAGKSTFLEALRATLGDYSRTLDFESLLQKPASNAPRNDIAGLVGRRLAISIEVDEGRKLAEALVKNLTGDERISARYLYSEYFEFSPTFHLFLACNDAPVLSHSDDALWRRVLRIPFVRSVPPERVDKTLKKKLRDPAVSGPAILAWCVRGALEWQKIGLCPPEKVLRSTERYREEVNPLAAFISDCCIVDPSATVRSASLRQAYLDWCREQNVRPLGPRKYSTALAALGVEFSKATAGVRVIHGIGLLEDEE
jgi:putative DNA primase/helicase